MPPGMKQPLKGPFGSQFCDSCQIFQITACKICTENFVHYTMSPQVLPKCLDLYRNSQRKPSKTNPKERGITFNNL